MDDEMNDSSRPQQRLLMIDGLRGVAIVMMVVFHFCFDLSYFGLAGFDFYHDSFWLHARTLILSSFLFLVGVSLVLATRRGLVLKRYLRRLGYLVAAALLVSVSTRWMFADRFVFFGVLHFIALASVLGLLFVRAGWANLILGIAVIIVANHYQSPWFDETGRRWIGLMTHKPPTEDYVPLLPWFGVVMLGLFAGPAIQRLASRLQPHCAVAPVEWLAFAGRHSLLIYLLHQPLLLGALTLYTQAASAP
jgi:uncharacterized membrane protein